MANKNSKIPSNAMQKRISKTGTVTQDDIDEYIAQVGPDVLRKMGITPSNIEEYIKNIVDLGTKKKLPKKAKVDSNDSVVVADSSGNLATVKAENAAEGLSFKSVAKDAGKGILSLGSSAFDKMFPTIGKFMTSVQKKLEKQDKEAENASDAIQSYSKQVSESSSLLADIIQSQNRTTQILQQILVASNLKGNASSNNTNRPPSPPSGNTGGSGGSSDNTSDTTGAGRAAIAAGAGVVAGAATAGVVASTMLGSSTPAASPPPVTPSTPTAPPPQATQATSPPPVTPPAPAAASSSSAPASSRTTSSSFSLESFRAADPEGAAEYERFVQTRTREIEQELNSRIPRNADRNAINMHLDANKARARATANVEAQQRFAERIQRTQTQAAPAPAAEATPTTATPTATPAATPVAQPTATATTPASSQTASSSFSLEAFRSADPEGAREFEEVVRKRTREIEQELNSRIPRNADRNAINMHLDANKARARLMANAEAQQQFAERIQRTQPQTAPTVQAAAAVESVTSSATTTPETSQPSATPVTTAPVSTTDMMSRLLNIKAREIVFKADKFEFPSNVFGSASGGGFVEPSTPGGGGAAGGSSVVVSSGGSASTPTGQVSDLKFGPGVDPRINEGVATKIKQIESISSKPFTITSGYRDPQRNASAGGARNSAHMRANAVDIQFQGNEQDTVNIIQNASAKGIGGIGVYRPGWLHLDTENKRVWGPDFTAKTIPQWAKPALDAHMGNATAEPAEPSGGGGGSAPAAAPAPSAPSSGAAVARASASDQASTRIAPPPSNPSINTPGAPATSPAQQPGSGAIDPNNPGPVEPADAAIRYSRLFNMAA
jgi:hypothetical protein